MSHAPPFNVPARLKKNAESDSSKLSVSFIELKSTTTPKEVLEAIWNKAKHLMTEPNAVLPALECDSSSRMVIRTSGSGPPPCGSEEKWAISL